MKRKIYVVGGAVRNVLMGLEPNDLDYVVDKTRKHNSVKMQGNNAHHESCLAEYRICAA